MLMNGLNKASLPKKENEGQPKRILILFKGLFSLKPSTENLLFAIEIVWKAACEKRSDLNDDILKDIAKLRAKIQYLKEIECE
jgi:hypothetical protein